MNTKTKILTLGISIIFLLILIIMASFKPAEKRMDSHNHLTNCGVSGCTFKTLFGEEPTDGFHQFKSREAVEKAVNEGVAYLITAQQKNGGWGAGSHSFQQIRDAHAVKTDPATTAMVGMAILRNGNTLRKGELALQLRRATDYLLKAVEETPANQVRITDQTNTQIQVKLGSNIDAVLAAQYFNNLLDLDDLEEDSRKRVKSALKACVARIEKSQNSDGSLQGDGWAGVLQSSLANQALEAAEVNDIAVDKTALLKAKDFQTQNFNAESGSVKTDRGAGIVLYAVSGSVRASAKDANKAKKMIQEAKERGEITEETEVSPAILEQLGLSKDEASRLNTSYNVYESAKNKAQESEVLSGFGNNGGEEFISFLQTGESMVIAGGNDWEKWYADTAGRILRIQNEDGSWSGHHCITSPVFCTATCLLILSIDQDIERLQKLGEY